MNHTCTKPWEIPSAGISGLQLEYPDRAECPVLYQRVTLGLGWFPVPIIFGMSGMHSEYPIPPDFPVFNRKVALGLESSFSHKFLEYSILNRKVRQQLAVVPFLFHRGVSGFNPEFPVLPVSARFQVWV